MTLVITYLRLTVTGKSVIEAFILYVHKQNIKWIKMYFISIVHSFRAQMPYFYLFNFQQM